MLKDKCILLGVSGGIAAYKIVELASRLVKLRADVHVVMTKHATEFVTPLTFSTITGNKVIVDMFEPVGEWDVKHISLSAKTDLTVIAPATANIIGKMANGIADDFLTTELMATKSPILLCPSMNTRMYENQIFQENLAKLRSQGHHIMEPGSGFLACRDLGKGRLPEPSEIQEAIINILCPQQDLKGKKVLITAGPTREAIDPVRYISNHSSGKMGFAVAEAAIKRGADVTVVSGPVNIAPPIGAKIINVNSADEMLKAVDDQYKDDIDYVFFLAAVADYKAESIAVNKIKKSGNNITFNLVENPHIGYIIGQKKKPGVLHIGACAETESLGDNAKKKLADKNFDIIMANDVTQEGAGFMVDTNIVTLYDKAGNILSLPVMPKREVADKMLDYILEYKKNT